MFLMAEQTCLAKVVYYEARNQPVEGQIAVAKVALNRAESEPWPDSACAVINQKNQFSWTNQSLPEPEGPAWEKAKYIASIVYDEPDPTRGATHFHATYVNPKWAKKLKRTVIIGDHIFYE